MLLRLMTRCTMRTTITLDDGLARALKERAHRSGKSFKATVNETLRAGLTAGGGLPRPRSYQLQPQSLGAATGDIDLDKALRLADRLEDDAIRREMQLNK